jgi:hypothetical protein
MSEGSPRRPFYAADTSAFMEWQARYYPTDIFTSLPARMEGLIAEQRFFAPELVREELAAVGTADLTAWTAANRSRWVPTAELLAAAPVIPNRFPGLRDPKAEFEEADAYVIALAQLRDGIVVTQETSAAEKRNPKRTHFIPDVCRELGLSCISLLGLMRKEGWKL